MARVKHVPSVRLSFEPHAPGELRQIVQQGVDLYNVGKTGVAKFHELSIFLRDARGEILGGLLGHVWGGWLFVETLWIDESLRGRGHGRKLMRAAERYAIERGAHGSHLSTHSFQAPDFYRRLGYQVCGQIDDRPPGHHLYFMRKRLDPGGGGSSDALPAVRGARAVRRTVRAKRAPSSS
jgi:ribosomal protein S18 acetylase RimI-like enzyme